MIRTIKTATLKNTIWGINKQISDSIVYARGFCPFDNARDIFFFFRRNVIYKHDPPGVELLQSLPTFVEDNYWGKPFCGDCDCFTIAFTSCCLAQKIPVQIILAGNKPNEFTHIYNKVKFRGEWHIADLTQPFWDSERPYIYKKFIKTELAL